MFKMCSKATPAADVRPARTIPITFGSGPAVNLTNVRESGKVDLAKKADKAGLALSRAGLQGVRAQAVLVLDHSGSMRADYRDGFVAELVTRALGFALQVDADGQIPVIPFDRAAHPPVVVTVDNYATAVDRIWKPRDMGTTNLADALDAVLAMAQTTDQPLYCMVVTDGAPDSRPAATRAVIETARWPIFVKFLALRDVPYLQDLDDLPADRRLLDNVDAATITPGMSDLEFADVMAREWSSWIDAAVVAGVLTR